MATWVLDKFDSSDKLLRIFANDIAIMVDYDDVDHEETELLARFIVASQHEFAEWKKNNA